jgi:hypothetical protein
VLCFGLTPKVLANEQAPLSEEDELVMQLASGDYVSEDPLFIYHSPDLTMLPIKAIADSMGIALTIDSDTLVIEGWRANEQDTFRVDLPRTQLYRKGALQEWNAQTQYADDGFDIYVDQQSLQRWLSVKIRLDVPSLQLIVDSDIPLPALEKLAREKKRAAARKVTATQVPDEYIQNEYQWLGDPQFDFIAGADLEHFRGKSELRHNLVMQGRGDVAKHSMRASFIDNDGAQDLRLTLSRASEGPDKDLFLGFDRYELGDLSGFSDSLLFSSVQGRGLHIQRGGKSIEQQGDTVVIEGDAPPNWEVELYRNGSLVEFSQTTRDGRYRFEEVPIYLGENIFDVRLYGPQGQFREERETVSVGGAVLKAGEWEYQTLALNRNKSLIDSRLNVSQPESDFLLSEASYGLNRHFSLRAGFSSMTPNGATQAYDYWYGGLATSLGGVISQLLLAKDNDGGSGASLSIKAREFDTNINFDWLYFDSLVSDRNVDGTIKSEFNLRLNRSLFLGLPNSVLLDIDFRETQRVDGSSASSIAQRFSTGWAGYQVANDLTYYDSTIAGSGSRLEGLLSATRKWQGWRYKGGVEYQLSDSGRIDGVTLGAAHKFENGLGYTGSISHRFQGKDTFTNDNTLTWGFEHVSLSATAGFNSRGFQYLGASISSSLGYDAQKEKHFFSAASNLNDSTVTAQVFLDENANGVRDYNESPVSRVKFKGNSKWRDTQTDEQGLVTLKGIKHLEMQTLEVDERSIEDPFMKVSQGPVYIYTHSGSHVFTQVPLAMTIEVEGTIFVKEGEQLTPAPKLAVTLNNENGDSVQTVRSEYDGVFLFTDLLPGVYCAQVSQGSAARDAFSPSEPQCFDTQGSDGVVFLEDIVLRAAPKR